MRALLVPVALSLVAFGCARARQTPPQPTRPSTPEALPTSPGDAGNWPRNVASADPAPERIPAPAVPELETRPAVMPDDVEGSDELVPVARLVYRASFYVPASFRDRRVAVRAPAGELHVDVSANRLRARFVGPGWPVPEGSEVRLRSDLPGVYLFDNRGGRSLGAGELAGWFEGRARKRADVIAWVLRDYAPPAAKPLPTELVCALIAEWSHQERDLLAHRCEDGLVPPGFRLGPWSSELTAVLPMELPRRALRADEVDPPATVRTGTSGVLLEPAALARLPLSRALPGPERASLVVDNRTDARAIILAQGVPVAWVEGGASVSIDGLRPGTYSVGAIRPLGILRMPPRSL
ncbi:MAG: hypothetical protein ACHQ53_17140, partial [Polyangiales bacterium]